MAYFFNKIINFLLNIIGNVVYCWLFTYIYILLKLIVIENINKI